MRQATHHITFSLFLRLSSDVQGDDGTFLTLPSVTPAQRNVMNKNTLNMAIEAVPGYGDRISLFTKKLRLAQYADSTIYSYRLKISQAVLYRFHLRLPF